MTLLDAEPTWDDGLGRDWKWQKKPSMSCCDDNSLDFGAGYPIFRRTRACGTFESLFRKSNCFSTQEAGFQSSPDGIDGLYIEIPGTFYMFLTSNGTSQIPDMNIQTWTSRLEQSEVSYASNMSKCPASLNGNSYYAWLPWDDPWDAWGTYRGAPQSSG